MRFFQPQTVAQRAYYSAHIAAAGPLSGAAKIELLQHQYDVGSHIYAALPPYDACSHLYGALQPFQFLKEGDIAIQVGCHDLYIEAGISQPLMMRAIIGQTGRLVVVEPTERNAQAISRYAMMHGLDNISVVQVGLWDKPGFLQFSEEPDFSSSNMPTMLLKTKWSGMVHRWGRDRVADMLRSSVLIPVDVLASFLEMSPAPDFINLTANGAEDSILAGAILSLACMDVKPVLAFPLANVGLPFLVDLEAIGYYIAVADAPHRPWDKEQFFYACAIPTGRFDLADMGFVPAEITMSGLSDGLPTFSATPINAQFLANGDLVKRLAERSAAYMRLQQRYQNMPLAIPAPSAVSRAQEDLEWTLALQRGLGEQVRYEALRIFDYKTKTNQE